MSLALHVDGKYIRNTGNGTVYLRGVQKGLCFVDGPGAWWMGVKGWNPMRASQELDVIKSWGANIIRMHEVYQYWIQNTVDPVSGLTHRQIVHDLASMCNQKGLYLFLDGYCVVAYGETGHQQDGVAWTPYSLRPDVLDTPQDWIDMWVSFANTMKDLPNVLIEPHNEPVPYPYSWTGFADLWFTNLQACITAIRATGFNGLIAYQIDYGTWVNMDYPPPNSASTLDWAATYPITGGNLVISTHQYRDGGQLGFWSISHGAPPNTRPVTVEDITVALNYERVQYVLDTLHMPIFIGECGPNNWDGDQATVQTAWANQLQVYKNLDINYTAFWFRAGGQYSLLTSNTDPQPNAHGVILQNALPKFWTLTIDSNPQNIPFTIKKLSYTNV